MKEDLIMFPLCEHTKEEIFEDGIQKGIDLCINEIIKSQEVLRVIYHEDCTDDKIKNDANALKESLMLKEHFTVLNNLKKRIILMQLKEDFYG